MDKKIILSLIILTFSIGEMKTQDAEFSQFYANLLYLNPAFAGSARCARFSLNYRNEWPGFYKTYVTYSASYDQYIEKLSGGVGLLVVNDKAGNGTINTLDASFMYSYNVNLNRQFSLKFALQGTYHQKSLDWTKLTFGDMIDSRRGFVYNTNEIPNGFPVITRRAADISTGILAYSRRCYFGFAAHHLTQPQEGFISSSNSPLPMKFTAHMGAMIPLRGDPATYLSPNILYQYQGQFQQLNLGMYFLKGNIMAGLWYRNQDAVIVLVGYRVKQFSFGYSYDITISKLANASAGSHEISMQIQLNCRKRPPRFRPVNCPAFN